jgi:hypothetical protein
MAPSKAQGSAILIAAEKALILQWPRGALSISRRHCGSDSGSEPFWRWFGFIDEDELSCIKTGLVGLALLARFLGKTNALAFHGQVPIHTGAMR